MSTREEPDEVPEDREMRHAFAREAARSGISVQENTIRLCVRHWRMVVAYNQRTNLTSIATDEDAILLHYLDSLAAAPLLRAGTVVDFGSGAGFPGLPLAIARPDLQFTLVEPRRKRVSFLRLAVATLGLQNVRVLEARLEDLAPQAFTQAVTRATFSDDATLGHVRRWLSEAGCLLIWRAGDPPEPGHDTFYRVLRHPYALGHQKRSIEQWIWPPARA